MATELREGAVLDGKYRIGRRLAEGGMGVVFVAEHLFLKKPVAVKVLHPQLSEHPEAVERFTVEARAASLIDHENVVRISDFGRADGQLYLVMELLDGHDLAAELDHAGPLSITRARFVACQVLRGLGAAHARGVVHRDLKPENVFICQRPDADDVVKILDFGIARMRPEGAEARLTKDGTVMGTPLYMAPEQLKGALDLDARGDLYAVGVLLYEMLAGSPPYAEGTFGEIAHAILDARPRPLHDVEPSVDPVLSALIMKAFAKEREARFQTAAELLAALERYRIDETAAAPSPWIAPRISQLVSVPSPNNTTVRDRAQPLAHAPTLDGLPALADELPELVEVQPPAKPRTQPRLEPRTQIDPGDEPALELDRPPPPPVETPAPPSRRNFPLIALAILFLGAGATGYFYFGRTPPPPAQVTIRLFDLPRGAQVFLDGTPSSASFTMPGDREQHRVRLQAPGYADKGLLFTADDNQQLDGKMTRRSP